MRCPECSQRNSVAARKCAACGSSLRRKGLPLGNKAVLGTVLAVAFIIGLAALSTALINPEKALTNTANTLTSKSTSADQMMGNLKNFDHASRKFLEKYGSLDNNLLSEKLSTCLPKSLYENHVFDLLPNLKLVEIDTALNASNYLILLSNGKTEVLPIIGLDVYDSNSFLPQSNKAGSTKKENEGQLLVLLGHSTDIHGHHPKVKVLLLSSTLQSDNIVDLTDTVVPKIDGEGSAKFSPNQKDIELSIALHSRGEEQNLFSATQLKSSLPIANESIYEQLIWQDNAYTLRSQAGNSKMYALYAAASALKNHNKLASFHNLSASARRTIEQTPTVTSEKGFTITACRSGKRSFNTSTLYELRNDSTRALVDLKPIATGKKGPSSVSWFVNSLTISHFKPSTASVAVASTTEVMAKPKTTEEKPKAAENKIIEAATPVAKPLLSKPKETIIVSPAKPKEQPKETKPVTPAVKANNAANSATTPSNTPAGTPATFVRGLRTYIKLRSGPGTSNPSSYDINPNSQIAIIGKENGWYKVKVDNKEGYVYAGLLSSHKYNGYVSKTVRQNGLIKDEQQHVIDSAHAGEHIVLISGLRNNRYKVILSNGKTGYVSKETLDGSALSTQPAFVP